MLTLQDLNKSNGLLCLKVARTCAQLGVKPGHRLLLGVSGGADSVALALILKIIAPRLDVTLECVHIDHGLRRASVAEAEFVKDFCYNLQLRCSVVKADVKSRAESEHCGLEEAGRLERYEHFEAERQRLDCDFILVAHHALDLCEDILMRLTRGSGWPALAGMSAKNQRILRPLLHYTPVELKSLLVSCGCGWVDDPSNEELKYKRNRFRHLILPILQCENPSLERAMIRLHELGSVDAEYWDTILAQTLAKYPWDRQEYSIILPKELLDSLLPAARLRLYMMAINTLRSQCLGRGQARAETLLGLDTAFQAGRGGKVFQCSGGITATLRGKTIIFSIADAL